MIAIYTKQQKKESKQRVESILKLQGKTYDGWLCETHEKYINQNLDYVLNELNKKNENEEI